jgi:DNA primase
MDQVSSVREKIDIISLLSEYLPLKKTGRNFKANCPFHQEKTPSFVVSPERQIWHCFGCGKGGDAFTFLMEYENMEFPEALRTLAKRAGVTLTTGVFKDKHSEKERIYELNKLAARFFCFLLNEHKVGKTALSYLEDKRKLNKKLIESYSLGYAPSDNSLSAFLIKKKGFAEKDLVDAGLAYNRGGKVYDFFRNRITFPLTDHRGNIVGFSGRALSDSDMPKYINTKDTIVYHKGSLFFGMDKAREEIKKKDELIVVEGEFDAIALWVNGIKNAVAIKGTALTETQANLISRFTKKVTLCLDQDDAGYEATKRSLANLEKYNLTTTVVIIPGKDPDEAIKKSLPAFKKALRDQINVYDFIIEKTLSTLPNTVEGKKKATEELLPYLSQIQNEIVKEHYVKKLAKEIDSSSESLFKELEKLTKSQLKDTSVILPPEKRGRRELLEEYFLSIMIQNDPVAFVKEEKEFLREYEFQTLSIAKILDYLKDFLKHNKTFNPKRFGRLIPAELLKTYDICFVFPVPKFEDEERFKKEIEKIKSELMTISIKEKIQLLTVKLRDAKDKNEEKDLQKEFSKLVTLLPK